jgi:hypothetical protein
MKWVIQLSSDISKTEQLSKHQKEEKNQTELLQEIKKLHLQRKIEEITIDTNDI